MVVDFFFLRLITGIEKCDNSASTLAYAAACAVDSFGRPLAGYINLCPSVCQVQVKI